MPCRDALMATKHGEFIDERIIPVPGAGDAAAMARGEPGLPARFIWRGREYRIAGLIEKWKTSGPCRSGAAEVYLRRHWYKVLTDGPAVMTIYCDRQAKDRKRPKRRWWVYSVAKR